MKQTVDPIELSLNSELVVFGWYGEGYYSNSEAYEVMFLPKEQYELFELNEAFKGIDKYFYELDAKHSEVEGEVFKKELTVEQLLEDKQLYKEILKKEFEFYPTNESWFKKLFGDTSKYEFNLYSLLDNYLSQLKEFESSYTQLTFTVPAKFEDEIYKLIVDFLNKNK